MTVSRIAAALLTGGMLTVGVAGATDLPAPPLSAAAPAQAEAWAFSISPYFWAAGLSGDIAQFHLPATVHISPDFDDILRNLDFAAMVMGEARKGRVSFVGDIIYSKVSIDRATPRGVIADTTAVTSETFSGMIAAGYSLALGEAGHLDIVAGAKVWSVSSTVSLVGGNVGSVHASDSRTWVDALVGVRGRYDIADNVYLTGWGLVGAGGAKLDWDVAAALGYDFNENLSALAGYRALGVNYDSRGFVFDVVQQGPIVALVAKF